jgi:virulence factor Mce-like protein
MGRLLVIIGVGAGVLLAALLPGGGESKARRYTIELDNAFGVVQGGDVRIAGTNAGTVAGIRLDMRTKKALIDVDLTARQFGPLKRDAFCETRPQSPLGEHFIDCRPGTSTQVLPEGGRLPVARTASTIPPDLIANVMRVPYRQRLRLVLNELGAGLAGRPEDLNAAIRRAVPALRQTSQLLRILARHDRVIRDLTANADSVIGELARNRRDVGRFVVEARNTAQASAERADDLATNWRKLPRFLTELTPTMAALGETATEQRPVLADLSAAAPDLREFLDHSADFADVSRPALRELGETAKVGNKAAVAARPTVAQLRKYAEPLVDLGPNLRITLEDFSDPGRAVEKDPRSPGGNGYSGAQALLQYIFNQTLVNNGFDELGHMVRAGIFTDHCSAYTDAEDYKKTPAKKDCPAWLGPTQLGVTMPDPSASPEAAKAAKREERRSRRRARQRAKTTEPGRQAPGGSTPDAPVPALPPQIQELLDELPKLTPDVPKQDLTPLLDYLLAR